MSKEKFLNKKEEMPVVPFESLSPTPSEEVLEELHKRGLRPATLEEIKNLGTGSKYLVYEDGEWQLKEKKTKSKESND